MVGAPVLFQVNTRVLVADLARSLGRPATLDDIPESAIDAWAADGFDWIWLLGVWQTGAAGRRISASRSEWLNEYRALLPDLRDSDICGSPFAVASYSADETLGGDAALARFRERLRRRGLRLMLDFVPNHTALDHPWVAAHPEFYVSGSADDLAREPQNYRMLTAPGGSHIFAHGRDPYFPGWTDTLQLNYAEPAFHYAMQGELVRVAERCDGVRCDMAMLVLPDVFERTWGKRPEPFWGPAIARVRARRPGFVFMAEAYWGLEWTLQQQGFDYTYDKTLYDRLRDGNARGVREHLAGGLDYQSHCARFLENHDEPRAAAVFDPAMMHRAAAVITYFAVGLRFFHEGQFEGRRIRTSIHLSRRVAEPVDAELRSFYARLLAAVRGQSGPAADWTLLECVPAWGDNWTWDSFVCFAWSTGAGRFVAAVNYGGHQSQCYARLPFRGLAGRRFRLTDCLGDAVYDRGGDDLTARGLYLDLPPWGYNVFACTQI